MLITLEQMRKLHAVQLEMFKELRRVMEELGIRYYFVHGSLLGAVTSHRFIEEDDDIDIAIFRKDYDRLLEKGNKIIDSNYFIQDSRNDDFPLGFAKLRNCKTEFNQPILKRFKCNKGIYIDIFPIDFVLENERFTTKIKRYLLQARIAGRLHMERTFKQTCLFWLSLALYPSYRNAVKKREFLYSSCESSEYVTIFGGKATEQRMPCRWFGEGIQSEFCGLKVNCPMDYNAYLTRIYGEDFENKNPAAKRISADKKIEISASFVDFGGGDVVGQKTD